MGALTNLQLLPISCHSLLPVIKAREEACLSTLEEVGSTVAINGYRVLQIQRIVIAIGMYSSLEAALKWEFGWNSPSQEMKKLFVGSGYSDTYQKFELYWLAINVLKHGDGASYDRLLKKSASLPFRIKRDGEWFFEEGDLAENHSLVLVDDSFLLECAEIISSITSALEELVTQGILHTR